MIQEKIRAKRQRQAMPRCNSVNRGGFTLVELLVVIGIISLLIGLLLPALTRARAQANKIKCESNLRQVGIQMLIYADSSGGYLFPDKMGWDAEHVTPWPATIDSVGTGGTTPFGVWTTAVFGVWNPPVMICPSDLEPVGQHSYLVNEYLAVFSEKYGRPLPGHMSASDVVLMGEKTTTSGDYYMEYGDFADKVETKRHGISLGSNYLKLDLHVDTLAPSEISPNALDPWDYSDGSAPPPTSSQN